MTMAYTHYYWYLEMVNVHDIMQILLANTKSLASICLSDMPASGACDLPHYPYYLGHGADESM